jgi:hypothetical protein
VQGSEDWLADLTFIGIVRASRLFGRYTLPNSSLTPQFPECPGHRPCCSLEGKKAKSYGGVDLDSHHSRHMKEKDEKHIPYGHIDFEISTVKKL